MNIVMYCNKLKKHNYLYSFETKVLSFHFYINFNCLVDIYTYNQVKELTWVLSSVVEHLTADQEVIGSNPIVAFETIFCLFFYTNMYFSFFILFV